MSRWYRFMYRVGITPWESDYNLVPQLEGLLTSEEADRDTPYGPALDLGCGTGRWSVLLAKRGWKVTGIDVVPKAVRAARERVRDEGVEVEILEGDVTALRDAGVAPGFSFFLDVECFNHLSDEQRAKVGAEVNAVASDDATMLLLVWTKARRGPLPPGAGPDDLTRALPGWSIVDQHPYEGEIPAPLRSASPRWFRLVRDASGQSERSSAPHT